MMKMPKAINASNCAGKKPDFAWNHVLAMHACGGPVLNQRLTELFAKASYRSNIALGVATFEWLLRRFEGMCDRKEARQLLEAGWATSINPFYFASDDTDDEFNDISGISEYLQEPTFLSCQRC